MTTRVFVDTSAWVAVSDKDESRHTEAAAYYRKLLVGPALLVTSLAVLAEAHILIRRRLGAQAASAFLKNANESARIEIIYPKPSHEAEAKAILSKYNDQDFSLADALSFVLMQENGVKEAFTYDRHFATAGFTKIP
jgi:predicted nucleic acid-binding protein